MCLCDREAAEMKASYRFRAHPDEAEATQDQAQILESYLCASVPNRSVLVPTPPGSAARRLVGSVVQSLAADAVSDIAPSQHLRHCYCYQYCTLHLYQCGWSIL